MKTYFRRPLLLPFLSRAIRSIFPGVLLAQVVPKVEVVPVTRIKPVLEMKPLDFKDMVCHI